MDKSKFLPVPAKFQKEFEDEFDCELLFNADLMLYGAYYRDVINGKYRNGNTDTTELARAVQGYIDHYEISDLTPEKVFEVFKDCGEEELNELFDYVRNGRIVITQKNEN